MEKMRIVYMGTPDFAVAPLVALIEAGFDVVGVVTVPDKPAGRGLKLRESAVKQCAVRYGIPVYQPERLKDSVWLEEFGSLRADLAVVVAFRMLPEVMWSAPRFGTFNLHASLLPMYRGAAPINWAIMNGDKKTGVTTFFLNHEIDCGEIISSREIDIDYADNVGTVHDKLMVVGAELVVETVRSIAEGNVNTHAQPELLDESRRFAPKIFKDDCKIDWSKGCDKIYDHVRGLSPYPAAWCVMAGTTAKIFSVHIEKVPHDVLCSTFVQSSDQIKVAVSDGWVYIDQLQLAGKKPMSAADFLRGNKL